MTTIEFDEYEVNIIKDALEIAKYTLRKTINLPCINRAITISEINDLLEEIKYRQDEIQKQTQ